MKLCLYDKVKTEKEEYIVTTWLHGSEIPKDVISIERNNKVIKKDDIYVQNKLYNIKA